MAKGDRYVKVVEWSDEDNCFIGSCPELFWDELGLIGYRTDITDAEVHSRRLREAAQRRMAG